LTAACRRDADAAVLAEQSRILEDAGARDRFVRVATAHGVLGLVLCAMQRAQRHEQRPLPGALQERLDALRRHAAIVQLERDRILAVLRGAGLDAVVLKGAGLAQTVYREPAERPISDLDLLLPLEHIDGAIAALSAKGYRPPESTAVTAAYRAHHFHVRVQRPSELIVELHWGLTQRREPERLDATAFLVESVSVAHVPPHRVPRAELALLHIVVEQVRDGFSRLLGVVDVDRIVAASPDMDWRYLIAHARAGDIDGALALALALSRALLGTTVPDEVRRELRPVAVLSPVRSLLAQRAQTSASWARLLRVWLLPRHSRQSALRELLRAESDDPLEWLWAGESVPRPIGTTARQRGLRVARVLGYQALLYGAAMAGLLRRGVHRDTEFW
jgi:hypothetical protein